MHDERPPDDRIPVEFVDDAGDDAAEIRYSLTALGEAVLGNERPDRSKRRFRGFGPCAAVA